jgi:branched-chain amino acid transport system permease protein
VNRTRMTPDPLQLVALLVLAIGLVALPSVVGDYWTRILTFCAVYSLAAAGAQVLYGRLGFVSLNQIALVGVGGWVFLRIGHEVTLPHPVLLLLAGVGTSVIGVLIGLPSLRLSGLALALVTLMAAAGFEVVFGVVGFPDGGDGLLGKAEGDRLPVSLPRPEFLESDRALYTYTVAVAALMFLVLHLLIRGRSGRAWMSIGQSVPGAAAMGVNVTRYRLVALVATSFVTGVGGGLLATGDGRLDPISFPAQQSIVLFAVVLIGGAYRLLGAAIAGFFYSGLPPLLNQLGLDGNLILVVFGVGLVHSVMTAPTGIAGQLSTLATALRKRFTSSSSRVPPVDPEDAERVVEHA